MKPVPPEAIEAGARALAHAYYVNEQNARLEDFAPAQQQDFREKARAVLEAVSTSFYEEACRRMDALCRPNCFRLSELDAWEIGLQDALGVFKQLCEERNIL